jgi:hypothetical protein
MNADDVNVSFNRNVGVIVQVQVLLELCFTHQAVIVNPLTVVTTPDLAVFHD